MKRLHTVVAAVLLALMAAGIAGLVSCSRSGEPGETASTPAAIWYCPMHPTYTSDHPGDCPICQMKLVPMPGQPGASGDGTASAPPTGSGPGPGRSTAPPAEPGPSRRRTIYRSTMNPGETSDRPAKDSMGMDMVPVEVMEPGSGAPAGYADVVIPPEQLQASGVTFGNVERKQAFRKVRTVGRIAFDETRVHHVHAKFSGWIEHLHVDYLGKIVRKGDPLFSIYSPDLFATQEEYLQALRASRALAGSTHPDVSAGGRDLLEAARTRLRLWDIREEEIAHLERTGQVRRSITIYSPVSGVVTEKNATHGMYVDATTREFSVTPLAEVWVIADLYEADLGVVREGQHAVIRLTYMPGRVFEGKVAYVYPSLNAETRTGQVRIEVANRDLVLKPNMFAEVDLEVDAGTRTLVPKPALLETGERAIAFVDLGGGRLAPREVRTGMRFDDTIEVLSGLEPGERVVTSAHFLIDSESRMRAAVGGAR